MDEGILRTGEFRKPLARGIIGIAALVLLTCLVRSMANISLPGEEEADHFGVSKEWQNAGLIHPIDSYNLMDGYLRRQRWLADSLSAVNLKDPLLQSLEAFTEHILNANSLAETEDFTEAEKEGFMKTAGGYVEGTEPVRHLPDYIVEVLLPFPDAEAEAPSGVPEIEEKPAVPVPAPDIENDSMETLKFSYSGELGRDYCPGSALELEEIVWMYGDETLSKDLLEIGAADTSKAGSYELSVTYKGESVRIPYGVVDYTATLHGNGGNPAQTSVSLWNYALDESAVEVPVWPGREFTGWYKDAECTVPFTAANRGETSLNLYAGWEMSGPFVLDEAGYIIDYIGDAGSITDGVLNIPALPEYVGIADGAFSSLGAGIYEVYIPANIQDIAPGVFDTLTDLWYIAVDSQNPCYCSVGGVLYTKDMEEIVAVPSG